MMVLPVRVVHSVGVKGVDDVSYQIITDATADMDWSLWDVCVIPMEVRLNNLTYVHGPNGTIGIPDFYKAQQAGAETGTSQISPYEFNRVFEKYLSQGMDILYLGFSSGMSGTFQNSCLTVDELMKQYPERRIICVDTLAASVMEGYLVYEAARKKAEGIALEDLADWVKALRKQAYCRFVVDDLNTLKRGGRISSANAFVGTTLQIKPILKINEKGCLQMIDKKRGRKKSINDLLNYYHTNSMKSIGGVVVIGHGNCLEDAETLRDAIQEQYPNTKVIVTHVGPVIGAHTGAGMLSIAFC
ncbi:Protein DegV [bioreactor metagenome]|uniref:Protein DegV n=1 Tax=bioreactor metagenome TaxID=1076179 RepID=A0A644W4U4_9ZZZZ